MLDGGEQTAPAGGSAVPESPAPNIVRVNGETVTLYPRVPMALGIAAMTVVQQGQGNQAVTQGLLAEVYLRFGISDWTWPDPINAETIVARLPFEDGGLEVAEAADALYSGAVFAPLVKRLSRLSPTGPTDDLTPVTPLTGSTPPTPSGPSSPTGMDGLPSEDPAP